MFYERLVGLCKVNQTNITNLLKNINLSTSKGTAWKNGSIPSGDIISAIADYFNTTTDYLLGKTEDPSPRTGSSPDEGREVKLLRRNFNLMNQYQRDKMINVLSASFDEFEWKDDNYSSTLAAHGENITMNKEEKEAIASIKKDSEARRKRENKN